MEMMENGVKVGGGQLGKGFYTSTSRESSDHWAQIASDLEHKEDFNRKRGKEELGSHIPWDDEKQFWESYKAGQTQGSAPEIVAAEIDEDDYQGLTQEHVDEDEPSRADTPPTADLTNSVQEGLLWPQTMISERALARFRLMPGATIVNGRVTSWVDPRARVDDEAAQ